MHFSRRPLSTYRLQLNHLFTFADCIQCLPYLHALGVTDLYFSSLLKAHKGSLHGYDVIDFEELNPEIGNESELITLSHLLQEKEMGLIVDWVVNHMCIGDHYNKWWQEVLENGPNSVFATYFNIIWDSPKAKLYHKILLPVLDSHYGKVIENEELKLCYRAGAFFLCFKERLFPLTPTSWHLILNPLIQTFQKEVEETDPTLLELQSIVTNLSHLPDEKEENLEKAKERHREKEILKKRLFNLLEDSPPLLRSLEKVLLELNGKKGNPHSFDALEEILQAQHYRLSYWGVTNDEINYRRFFDINELIGLCIEREEVFNSVHKYLLILIEKKIITGLRIDHVDGLFDPAEYFTRLQNKIQPLLTNPQEDFYILVEKILCEEERLRENWQVAGTTGYDFLNDVNRLFVKGENSALIESIYKEFTNQYTSLEELFYNCKKLILIISMSSELHILASHLESISEQHRWSRDYTLESLRASLRDVIACFPVYRTYIQLDTQEIKKEDRKAIIFAVERAKRFNPASDPSIFDFIQSILVLEMPPGLTEEEQLYRRQFVCRFQQLTGPVMAKGFEDTALYRFYPLTSLNEVGSNLKKYSLSLKEFHAKNNERKAYWPYSLLATSTHDSKRSEDVRMRLNVLSEIPKEWQRVLNHWKELNQAHKSTLEGISVPNANEEYLLYQTLIGSWPLYPMDASSHAGYIERIDKYMIKALKEAKLHSSWIHPNKLYEKEVQTFIRKILNADADNLFLKEFLQFITPITKAGMFSSLSQLIIKMTAPGIPDFYQGSELWEFALVDPDNRHPVDYTTRQNLLNTLLQQRHDNLASFLSALLEKPEDGRIKLYVTFKGLNLRKKHPLLFQEGAYEPLKIEGEKKDHLIAYSRTHSEKHLIIVVSRFYYAFFASSQSLINQTWHSTDIHFGKPLEGRYREVLSNMEIEAQNLIALPVSVLFSHLPFAILEKIND